MPDDKGVAEVFWVLIVPALPVAVVTVKVLVPRLSVPPEVVTKAPFTVRLPPTVSVALELSKVRLLYVTEFTVCPPPVTVYSTVLPVPVVRVPKVAILLAAICRIWAALLPLISMMLLLTRVLVPVPERVTVRAVVPKLKVVPEAMVRVPLTVILPDPKVLVPLVPPEFKLV